METIKITIYFNTEINHKKLDQIHIYFTLPAVINVATLKLLSKLELYKEMKNCFILNLNSFKNV